MKTIGMLGGMSWESTATYYRLINEGVRNRLGNLHSARISLFSVDFQAVEQLQNRGDWDGAGELLAEAAGAVERGGADFLLLCTNTMHKVAPRIEKAIGIPLLHIADATAGKLQHDGIKRVGLLGTRFTMEQDFYKSRLTEKFAIEVLIPEADEREDIHRIIYQELCLGKIEETSRETYLAVIETLAQRGAEAVILGCTEIALLVQQSMTGTPLYDTTALHCQAAVALAIDDRDGS